MLSAHDLIQHIDQAFTAWQTHPWAQDYSFEQFCEYLLPYRASDEPLEDWRTPLLKEFAWLPDSLEAHASVEDVCTLMNRHLYLTANVGFSRYPVAQPLSTMQQGRMGTCREQVNLALFAMRAQGLAVAHDFTPVYANYHTGHDWNALITPEGKSYDFMGTFRAPAQHYLWWKAAKVYRRTYSAQSGFPHDAVDPKNVPPFFRQATIKDVTADYFPVSDITVALSAEEAELPIAYLCTFGDREWYPIHWGEVTKNRTVTFTDLGRGYQSEDTALVPVADDLLYFTQIDEGPGIVYAPMQYTNRQLLPIGPAMVLTLDGEQKSLVPDTTRPRTLTLRRKYPETLRKRGWRTHVAGATVQGANRADFSDAKTLFTVAQPPGEHSVTVPSADQGPFRYVRFLMNQDTLSSIAEVAFYGPNDERLSGTLIRGGTFSLDGPPESAVDRDPLTYAEGSSGDNYVGWDLQQPMTIGKITYQARNDGNAIQPGDRYELLYWNREWVSLGKQRADTTFLTYPKAPTNALFWLRNLSRGREERIFTYENGRQVWW